MQRKDPVKHAKAIPEKTRDLIHEIRSRLPDYMTPSRLSHSVSMFKESAFFSEIYGIDPGKSEIACLLHDIARDMPGDMTLKLYEKNGIAPDSMEIQFPLLMHGRAGALIARNDFGIIDEDILNAITYHTVGRRGMSTLEKLVYVLDFAEPSRKFKESKKAYRLLKKDLPSALLYCLTKNFYFLLQKQRPIAPGLLEAYNEITQE